MQVTDGRCLKCRTPVEGDDAWYCSEECYDKALAEFIPDKFKRGIESDSRYKWLFDHATVQELLLYTDQWEAELASLVVEARARLHERIESEVKYAKEHERRRAEEILYKERVRQLGRLQVEKERQQREQAKQEAKQLDEERKREEAEAEERLREEEFERLIEPRPIPEKIRFEHTHILGPSGSGKTTLIQELILNDLQRECAVVVIDPKGELINRLRRLRTFENNDRLVVIDPADEPALNMFSHNEGGRLAQAISNFAYIFSQSGQALTPKMIPVFTMAARLLYTIPHANLYTLMDLMADDPKVRKFQPYIDQLDDEGARRFLAEDFYSSNYADTRPQIRGRLYELISRPEIRAMFNARTRTLNMFDCLQQKKVVLVNTARPTTDELASQLLGRYMIALTLNAAYARYNVPRREWYPAFLYIDEFQDFADERKTSEMLRLAREYNLGVTLAHQNLYCMELNDALRSAISTNTAIKYCANVRGSDLGYMAKDMSCDQDFLKAQQKSDTHARFACYVSGMDLTHPFQVEVPLGNIDRAPRMSDEALRRTLERNRNRLAETHKPAEKAGLRVAETIPAEADTPIVATPQPKKPAIGTHTETGEDW